MICARAGCTKTAGWLPVLELRARVPHVRTHPFLVLTCTDADECPCKPFHMRLQYPHCRRHRRAARVKDVLSDDGWNYILRSCDQRGLHAPDRSRVLLKWDPIGPRDIND